MATTTRILAGTCRKPSSSRLARIVAICTVLTATIFIFCVASPVAVSQTVVEPAPALLVGTWKGHWRHKSSSSWPGNQTIQVLIIESGGVLKTEHKVVDRDGKTHNWWSIVEVADKNKVRMSAQTFSRVETYKFERDGKKCKLEGSYLFKGEDFGRAKLEKDCP